MFTEIARRKTVPYWEGSFQHPFIQELQAGTLAMEKFRYYLLQDRYYLEHFSKLYALIAAQTTDEAIKEMLLMGAQDLAAGELMIRAEFFAELDITPEEIVRTPIAPTAYHYVSHMYRQVASGSVKSALAGLLPCPWLYQEIGVTLVKQGSPVPLYQRWLETYAGEEGAEGVWQQCDLVNRLYEEAEEQEQLQMIEAFEISAKMEYLFWEMSYTLETWPAGERDVKFNA